MIKQALHKNFFIFCLLLLSSNFLNAQVTDTLPKPITADSLGIVAEPVQDSKIDSVLKKHSPKKAAIRSAIIPGWGQAYNKKYWKIPIVYAVIGTTVYFFFDNLNTYRDLRFAYQVKNNDSTNFDRIRNKSLLRLDPETIRYNRDEFRRNIDYSVIFFLVAWGLNVVDATVDAHLKSFDVSPDLSFRLKMGKSDIAKTTGLSLILAFK